MRLSQMLVSVVALGLGSTQVSAQTSDPRVAERFTKIGRGTVWEQVDAIPVQFPTFHPQGMVKVGDAIFVSSVEIIKPTTRFDEPVDGYDRDTGEGVGRLFKFDLEGKLIADLVLGEGSIYHPGGIDFDGEHIWVPVAEYRPDSASIVYRVDPETMEAEEVFRFPDHLGGIVHDTDASTLHAVSWGSRRFYRFGLDADGGVPDAAQDPASLQALNPAFFVDYQDCKYAGSHQMLCSGTSGLKATAEADPFWLGGLELVDLEENRPVHQVPVQLWTKDGLDMTHNPVWIEPSDAGLRGYFMPEDDASTVFIYDAVTEAVGAP